MIGFFCVHVNVPSDGTILWAMAAPYRLKVVKDKTLLDLSFWAVVYKPCPLLTSVKHKIEF